MPLGAGVLSGRVTLGFAGATGLAASGRIGFGSSGMGAVGVTVGATGVTVGF